MAARDGSSQASIRALLKQKLPPEIVVDEIIRSFRGALEAEKPEWIECRQCHTKTAVVLPNLDARVKAAVTMLSELEGKVGTQKEAPSRPKSVGNLEELSDEELLALVGEDHVGEVDGGAA